MKQSTSEVTEAHFAGITGEMSVIIAALFVDLANTVKKMVEDPLLYRISYHGKLCQRYWINFEPRRDFVLEDDFCKS